MSADGEHVTFRQTNPDGPENGILHRTVNGCSVSSLAGTFSRNLSFASGPDEPALAAGSYEVQSDCFVK